MISKRFISVCILPFHLLKLCVKIVSALIESIIKIKLNLLTLHAISVEYFGLAVRQIHQRQECIQDE